MLVIVEIRLKHRNKHKYNGFSTQYFSQYRISWLSFALLENQDRGQNNHQKMKLESDQSQYMYHLKKRRPFVDKSSCCVFLQAWLWDPTAKQQVGGWARIGRATAEEN